MVQPWQLEQSEEPEQDLMDKFGLRTGSGRKECSTEGLNVTAARNSSDKWQLHNFPLIGAISPEKVSHM